MHTVQRRQNGSMRNLSIFLKLVFYLGNGQVALFPKDFHHRCLKLAQNMTRSGSTKFESAKGYFRVHWAYEKSDLLSFPRTSKGRWSIKTPKTTVNSRWQTTRAL